MRAYQILNETKTTLSALYKNGFPDRDEEFWNEVTRSDLDIPLEINKIAPYKLGIILTSQYRIEHIDELVLKGEQKRVVNQYRKDPNLSDSIIVMSDGRIIDGNHRALAAYLTKRPINYVDLNDLAEITEDEDYRIDHRAPMHDSGSPLYDVTGTYPDDIYGPKAIQYYGTREPWDSRSIRVIQLSRNKPNQTIQIFRAVPKEVKSNTINPGDWVTVSREYATQHGKGLGKYKLLSKIVPAKTLFTNGDSIHEWGYDPGGAAVNESLSSLISQDQSERNAYSQFVKSQAGGDWTKGAAMYAKVKKRPSNDIFGEKERLNQFMKMKFDFTKFTNDEWDNYWLLAQHCDFNRNFQQQVLAIIKKYQGVDNSHYHYLADRISCGTNGTQKYGTQDICTIDTQPVAEGSEQEGLVSQFLKSITPKELRYYSIRDNCGPAALHMMDWAKEKGIELNRVHGYFVADNVVYDKADFTKEMKHEFLQQGLDFNDPKSRQEFIASNPKYSKEWKKVPHYWLQDDQGTVYDPTGYTQFIKTGVAKDLDKSRYETVQGMAEDNASPTKISFKVKKGRGRFATEMIVNGQQAGVYQYDANTGRSIAEVFPEFRSQGLGKILVLHAIYTAAKLGLDFQEDESRTAAYDNVLDSLSSNGYIVDDDGYWYVTGEGEQYLQQSLKNKAPPVAENFADGKGPIAQKIFFARSKLAPKGYSYDHVGFITQDGKQIQMSGHKGNEVYVTNAVTDDPEFPKQTIKIVSLSKPVSVPTTNTVGAENCGTFVANVLQANGIKGIDLQKLYSVFKPGYEHPQPVAEGSVDPTQQDLTDVADWMNTTSDKIKVVVKQEPIEKFLQQIREMYSTYDEFPKDAKRTNRIVSLLKKGEKPLPIYVEANDPHLFAMEGRHRMVAFWLAGMKTIPVAYVYRQNDKKQGVTEDKSNRPISISKSVDGGSLEGYVIDSSAPQLTNYLHSQGASDDVINKIKSQYTRIAILRNMSVDEDNRGQGIGNYLVSTAIENATYNGAEVIVLVSDTGEDNQFDLTKWYEGFGFEIHGSASGDPVMILEL